MRSHTELRYCNYLKNTRKKVITGKDKRQVKVEVKTENKVEIKTKVKVEILLLFLHCSLPVSFLIFTCLFLHYSFLYLVFSLPASFCSVFLSACVSTSSLQWSVSRSIIALFLPVTFLSKTP